MRRGNFHAPRFATLPLCAQTAALHGQIMDESGAVVPGATVALNGPAGSRNRAQLPIEGIMEGNASVVGQKLIDLINRGVIAALKIYMDRVCPIRRERPVVLDLLEIVTLADLTACACHRRQGVGARAYHPDRG